MKSAKNRIHFTKKLMKTFQKSEKSINDNTRYGTGLGPFSQEKPILRVTRYEHRLETLEGDSNQDKVKI